MYQNTRINGDRPTVSPHPKKKKKTSIDPQKLRFTLKYIYISSPPLKYLDIDPQEKKKRINKIKSMSL